MWIAHIKNDCYNCIPGTVLSIGNLEEGVVPIGELKVVVAPIVVVGTKPDIGQYMKVLEPTDDVSSRLDDCMVIVKVQAHANVYIQVWMYIVLESDPYITAHF